MGQKQQQYTAVYQSPLGSMLLAGDETGLTGLWFEGQKYYANNLDPDHRERELPVFQTARQWLDIYFSGKEPDFMPPLHLMGTPFQLEVWNLLLKIPYGTTTTYGNLAVEMAGIMGRDHMSAQAVGGAVGHNPVSVIVPCHRVTGADGSLTGYAGGIDKKIRLLDGEGADTKKLSTPRHRPAIRLTTLCYLEKDGKYLMLHRVSKENDENKDKWIGVGGHVENGESPEDCLMREVKEETGLTLTSYRFRGLVTFVSDQWGTEYMCLYTAHDWTGEQTGCDEGVLQWVEKEKVSGLPVWEGDKIFFRLLTQEAPFFSLKLRYEGDRLAEAVLDGKRLDFWSGQPGSGDGQQRLTGQLPREKGRIEE